MGCEFQSMRVPLVQYSVDEYVPWALGTYALRVEDVVAYVGRSDTNLNGRLKDYLHGNERDTLSRIYGLYDELPSTFDFVTFPNVAAAYDMECDWFHKYQETIVNQIHPAKPDGMVLACRVCGFTDTAVEALKIRLRKL